MRILILILLFVWCLSGCKDFLEEKSQTEIRPSTIKDMEKLLEGEAYWDGSDAVFADVTDIFTDDYSCKIVRKQRLEEKQRDRYKYVWSDQMFEDNGYGSDLALWKVPYNFIKGCNVILDYIDDMMIDSDDDVMKKEHLRGEAYVLRAFYHFYLVNFFGLPYTYGDPSKNLGVPLKISSGVDTDENPRRVSVAECYDQIVEDLEKGTKLMSTYKEAASSKLNRIDYLVGHALLSRVYLYMGKWDEAIAHADSVLVVRPELVMFSENPDKAIFSGGTGNSETLWETAATFHENIRGYVYPYSTSDNLINVFGEDLADTDTDLRVMTLEEDTSPGWTGREVTYLKRGAEPLYDDSGSSTGEKIYFQVIYKAYKKTGLRNAEVYLNRAEAYVRKYVEQGDIGSAQYALNDLNNLRRYRFAPVGFVEKEMADFSNAQELLEFCWRERRRELCGEGNHRWFDLRRQGMPEIKHVYIDNDSGKESEYVLQKEDRRYALPIPQEVRDRNPDLEQNKY